MHKTIAGMSNKINDTFLTLTADRIVGLQNVKWQKKRLVVVINLLIVAINNYCTNRLGCFECWS